MSYLKWSELKRAVEQLLKENGLEDIEVFTVDIWQPTKETVKIKIDNGYFEGEENNVYLFVRE